MNILHLRSTSIYDQLRLEEELLRHSDQNFCLINHGSAPTIVMGISGKTETLVHLDKLPSSIPILRRYSGGGTVIVDENTLFLTFICNKDQFSFPAYPEPILRWAHSVLAPVTPGLQLRENDFVLGEKKCGGNALYIKKDRWVIHTSFLWDYVPERMQLLKHPLKTPQYRAGRSHEEFVCKLSDHIPCLETWIANLKNHVQTSFEGRESSLHTIKAEIGSQFPIHYGTSLVVFPSVELSLFPR
jgi:lipoate-protein ligase A